MAVIFFFTHFSMFFCARFTTNKKNKDMAISFVLLDSSLTTYNVSINVDGVDTTQFEKNPVMFYQHNDWNMPVGRWENLRKENGQLLADAVFDYEDTNEDVQRMIKKVENGFIKMASCGLVDLEVSNDPVLLNNNLTVVSKCRLREASIVAIGGNHNAIRLYDAEDKEINLQDGMNLSDYIVKPKKEVMDKKFLTLLNLADTATDAEIEARVSLLLQDKQTAETELAAAKLKVQAYEKAQSDARKAEAMSLVDAAVQDGRIDAKGKDSFINFFDRDFDNAKSILSAIPVRESIHDKLNLGGNSELAKLTAMTWDEMDKKGVLQNVKTNYPDLYAQKYQDKFGKAPGK